MIKLKSLILYILFSPVMVIALLIGKAFVFYHLIKWGNKHIKLLNNLHERYASIICKNGGDILEIGFGGGTTSSFIQTNDIKSHTIIEIDKYFFNKLYKWSKDKSNVIPIQGDWLTSIPKNKKYDGILLDLGITPDGDEDRKIKLFNLLKSHTKSGSILVCTTDKLFDKDLYIKEGHYHSKLVNVVPPLRWYNFISKFINGPVITNKINKGKITYK